MEKIDGIIKEKLAKMTAFIGVNGYENLKSKLEEIERLQTRNVELSMELQELKKSKSNINTYNVRYFHS